jgi:endo-1,4-beta-xylanase
MPTRPILRPAARDEADGRAVSLAGQARAINGWMLTFTFPGDEKIINAWDATVTQTGASVSLMNVSYNTTIAPGGSQSFGFQETWTSNDTSPASFSLNGMACG